MLSLKDLYAAASTMVVEFRGKPITLTEPSAAQGTLLLAAFPRPMAPLAQDPNRPANEAHLLLPNENDPGYKAAETDWLEKFSIVELAIAMDYRPASGDAPPQDAAALRKWGDLASAELKLLPYRELVPLIRALSSFGDQDVKGNSSAPPTQP